MYVQVQMFDFSPSSLSPSSSSSRNRQTYIYPPPLPTAAAAAEETCPPVRSQSDAVQFEILLLLPRRCWNSASVNAGIYFCV